MTVVEALAARINEVTNIQLTPDQLSLLIDVLDCDEDARILFHAAQGARRQAFYRKLIDA